MESNLPPLLEGVEMADQEVAVNPFQVTKAVDFSDEQIQSLWVDFPEEGGFFEMAKPTSPMPMLILGGKGSGKTHLMRYFSSSLQALRHPGDVPWGIRREGFLGIYLRCGGLNASRFAGKGQDSDIWRTVFQYYMDIWIAQLTLRTVLEVLGDSLQSVEAFLCRRILELFDVPPVFGDDPSLRGLISLLHNIQRAVDNSVNNCVITRKLDVQIACSPARLIFGIPQILEIDVAAFRGLTFLYLIDEFENLQAEQQKYINTLVREKEAPCTFKIGARLYGLRTMQTFSADEEIKEGSEYERLPLDARIRTRKEDYRTFSTDLVLRRLSESGYADASINSKAGIEGYFENLSSGRFREKDTLFVEKKGPLRAYFEKLRKQLRDASGSGAAPGISKASAIEDAIQFLSCPGYPLLEKVNIYLLYQAWSRGESLPEAASAIGRQCKVFVESGTDLGIEPEGDLDETDVGAAETGDAYARTFAHYHADLLAQLYKDYRRRPSYFGFDTFVELSHGLPRNLLVILKNVFTWGRFRGEEPFSGGLISVESQDRGVRDASEWFFHDARIAGPEGRVIRDSIARLAVFFREYRFSDKPAEVALASFSFDPSQISQEAQGVIDLAEKWSLLVSVTGGQKDRNSMRVDSKYQLSRMLSPRWDLPVARRGTIPLLPEEINAIFGPSWSGDFRSLLQRRIEKLNVPFGRGYESRDQLSLFDRMIQS